MRRNEKAITLIALVITIIVLLILAGISIASLTGENGILTKASAAEEESKKAEYKEILQIIGNGLRPEKVLENLSTEEYMKRYKKAIEDEISKGGTLKGATVTVKNSTTLRVITKEGYVYEITEDEVKYVGKQGENPPPDLQESDIEFKLNPSGFTNTDVIVEIITKTDIGTNTLQYSTDGITWERYSTPITFQENGTIYARLINLLDEVGGVATRAIDTIDREKPNQATVSFSATNIDTDAEITATVTQSDNGASGIDAKGSKWVYTQSSAPIGENETSYTGGSFEENSKEIKTRITTAGTYYLHVLTVDNASNKTETIKGPITVTKPQAKVGEIVTGENKEYIKNGTAIIPVGFAIKPGCDDISQGLVISDVANDVNDVGNQFVWIPVSNEDDYKRNLNYPYSLGSSGDSCSPYDVGNHLPSGITDEKTAVVKAKGFYIASYETGIGLVSKKGASVITSIYYSNAINQSKNFINNEFIKSAIVSGTQWDVTMKFINGKYSKQGKLYNVTTPLSLRHRSGVESAGQNMEDVVCNIYDLEGNLNELTSEKAYYYSDGSTYDMIVLRAGLSDYNGSIIGASTRIPARDYANWSTGYRLMLYVMT